MTPSYWAFRTIMLPWKPLPQSMHILANILIIIVLIAKIWTIRRCLFRRIALITKKGFLAEVDIRRCACIWHTGTCNLLPMGGKYVGLAPGGARLDPPLISPSLKLPNCRSILAPALSPNAFQSCTRLVINPTRTDTKFPISLDTCAFSCTNQNIKRQKC
jgi:hypothetical protein